MDAALKELVKLEKLINAKEKCALAPSILDSLLQTLYQAKETLKTGDLSPEQFISLARSIEATKREIDDRQKEVYSATSRFGKVLDKVSRLQKLPLCWLDLLQRCATAISDTLTSLFQSFQFTRILRRTWAHYSSTLFENRPVWGHGDIPRCEHFVVDFPSSLSPVQESSIVIPPETRVKFEELHWILKALRTQDIGPALACV